MKKTLAIILSVLMLSVLSVGSFAAGTTLLNKNETWTSADVGGESAVITFNDDGTINLKGSSTQWPCILSNFANPITLSGDDSIAYDFTFAAGTTSIVLFFSDKGTTSTVNVVINPEITDAIQDGSGDILPGTYQGSFKFSDLTLPEGAANEDGTYTITGLKMFTVGGADITINKLEVAAAAEASTDASAEESAETSTTPDTGDNGLAIFAVIAAISVAGALVVKKAR